MSLNLQILFRNMDASPSAEAQVRRRAAELEEFSDRISTCRVILETAHRHHRRGKLYQVSIDIAVPGKHVVANRNPGDDHAHEDIHVAIRDAFDAARRQLQDHMRRLEGITKLHEAPTIGHIARLLPDRDYGFLVTSDGAEIYVHRNSVVGGGFDKLKPGDRVRYVVAPDIGEKGAQASTVVPIGDD
jgi:cold shock CspA family protein/ribosome-associated translation inhibitor RaiA